MDFLSKIPDLAKLPTRYFAVVAFVGAAVLFLPTSILDRLSLGEMPKPYGTVLGFVFLICSGVVVVNSIGWLVTRRDANQRTSEREVELFSKLQSLDDEERAILREFVVFRKSTIGLPIDNPAVAGLRASGVIRVVGTVGNGSRFGIFFPCQLSRSADEQISDEMLGVPQHYLLGGGEGAKQLSEEGIRWLHQNRPAFAEGIDKFQGAHHRNRW